jgi:hypothetical protein
MNTQNVNIGRLQFGGSNEKIKFNMITLCVNFSFTNDIKKYCKNIICVAWYWHNKWNDEIENGSKFNILSNMLDEKFSNIYEK